MEGIIPKLSRQTKRSLEKRSKKADGDLRIRMLIILNLADGITASEVAQRLKVSRSTVYRVAARFRDEGEDGLIDRREENGATKLDDPYLATLWEVVESSPLEHGWKRPTWTREMLIETVRRKTGVAIHVSTMSDALKKIGARRGRPKPIVHSTWSQRRKNKRIRQIQQLVDDLPDDQVAVYEDEVDIHLNPKIGLDWMTRGQQKVVITPGKNQKRYLAGAIDSRTNELIWVEGDSKNTLLFIQLLWKLHEHYKDAVTIHVILDNYSIHDTQEVKKSLATEVGQRIQLHFLPPYCPDHNPIERVWQDLHANVTRNHTCDSMSSLMRNTRTYLNNRNRQIAAHYVTAA